MPRSQYATVDGDQNLDVTTEPVSECTFGGRTVYAGDGAGNLQHVGTVDAILGRQIALGEANGDGTLEVFVQAPVIEPATDGPILYPDLVVIVSEGQGGYAKPLPADAGMNEYTGAGDLNGDGLDDVLGSTADGTVVLLSAP